MRTRAETLEELLAASAGGDEEAFAELVGRLYEELRRSARAQLRAGRPAGLETTALVHEAYLKLAASGAERPRERGHFLAVAARAMRQLIVDQARAARRRKRGGGLDPVTLRSSVHLLAGHEPDWLVVDDALERLQALEPKLARLVELRVFAGLEEAEAATALGLSLRTTQRDWRRARAWLRVALEPSA